MDDGSKMGKSKGNVINPEDIIEEYGADAMRLYEMFMGPLNKSKPWNTKGLQGCYRFVNKLWFIIVDEEGSLSSKIGAENTADKETLHLHHTTIKKVENDIENLHFNTAVSQLMIYCNHLQKCEKIAKDIIIDLVKISAPFIPQLSEEFWSLFGHNESISDAPWPEFDEALTQTDEVTLAVQVNGKLRANISLDVDSDKETAVNAALELEKVQNYTSQGSIIKTIYVPNRLLNFVVN